MGITSPAITIAVPAMFGNIKPALDLIKKLGPTDFSADAPGYDIKPGATIKVPISGVSAASEYDEDDNNYFTGGNTSWASLTATHYLQGFDITGVNVDEGCDAPKFKQLFAERAGAGIAMTCVGNVAGALDGVTTSTGVVLPALASTGVEDYMGLGADKGWLNRATSVLALNGAEYANLKRKFANEHIIGTDEELAKFVGYKDIVCVTGMESRAVIVPYGSFGTIARVPAIIANYKESGVQVDEESGLAVGIVVADDQARNRLITNADIWFGTKVLASNAGATSAGAIKVGTQA